MNDAMLLIGWLNNALPGISESLALAAIATIAYLFGRRSRSVPEEPVQEQARREIKRAVSIAKDLEGIAASVRKELAAHHSSVVQFRARISSLENIEDRGMCQSLYEEAEQILAPTLKLASELSHAYDQIRQQSAQLLAFTEMRTDALTGVSNRRALDEQLQLMLGMLTRYERPFSIALFDIDHFKSINDKEGHLYGDHALQEVAQLFNQSIRETDFIARYGGEEFVIVMPQTPLSGAAVLAERLRKLVGKKLTLTVSGGIAEALATDTPHTLLSRADSALYSAKAAGRNTLYEHQGTAIRRVAVQNEQRDVPQLTEVVPRDETLSSAEASAPADVSAAADGSEPRDEAPTGTASMPSS